MSRNLVNISRNVPQPKIATMILYRHPLHAIVDKRAVIKKLLLCMKVR